MEKENQKPTTALAIKSQVENLLLKTPAKIVFSERFWNIWDNDQIISDVENYGIEPLFAMCKEFPDKIKIIFSDTVVEYYSNGMRAVKKAPFCAIINSDQIFWQQKKNLGAFRRNASENVGPYLTDIAKMKKAFREDKAFFESLEKKYPGVKWRFNVTEDQEHYNISMNMDGRVNACLFNYSGQHELRQMPFSTLTGLRKRFEAFGVMFSNRSTKAIDEHDEINTIEVNFGGHFKTVKTHVGFSDIPFDVAEKSVKDVKQLKHLLLNGAETFNVTLSGNLINETCNEFKFDENYGCCTDKTMILPPETYIAWSKPWTEQELALFSRERQFPYFNPDLEEEEQRKREVAFIVLPILFLSFGLGDWTIFRTGLWERNNELSTVLLAVSGLYFIFAIYKMIKLMVKKH